MAEYIERDAAVKVVLRERKPTNSVAQNRMLSIIQRDMLTMPAADVAPVVRCKDCKYLVDAVVNANGFLICDINDMEINPEDFCSYGERRGGGEDG